ncbi:hypothetical protein ADM99_13210 [Leptolinea tardivitalis]|uniref:Uncharacterized protein n=1 Tax=Leptolinea tardivitalis TaxID=229920 RepID=A0A0P6WX31_9CHLR|nr:hypothetical protein ADM99_13210 [Leptolinea tardivitalis]GAP20558.1 hypothetical protein LTAR_00751 [Leptolinea tardivitalis]
MEESYHAGFRASSNGCLIIQLLIKHLHLEKIEHGVSGQKKTFLQFIGIEGMRYVESLMPKFAVKKS